MNTLFQTRDEAVAFLRKEGYFYDTVKLRWIRPLAIANMKVSSHRLALIERDIRNPHLWRTMSWEVQ